MKDAQKLPALEIICTTDANRPTMNHIFLTREKFVATDAHVMVWHDTAKFFQSDFIEKIPEDGILIHAEDWKKMKICSFFQWHDKLIKINFAKKRPTFIEPAKIDDVGKYPNWAAVIPENTAPVLLPSICINPELLLRAKKAVNLGETILEMVFTGAARAILLRDAHDENLENFVGLLMPINPNNKY